MPALWAVIIGAALFILLAEIALWLLFERRVSGLHSHLAVAGRRQFFTLSGTRLFAIVHTIFLLTAALLSIIFVW